MTDEEVQQIYDYLHENYRYEDGNLIRKSPSPKNKRVKIGDRLGSFFYQSDQSPRIRCTLYIKKREYTKQLSHLIYLYHKKTFPDVIEFADNNPTNCCIENLRSISRLDIEFKKNSKVRGWKPFKSSNGLIRYRVSIQIGKTEKIHFGSCDTPDEAKKVYDLAKLLHIKERLNPTEIKMKVMESFPNIKMKLKKQNVWGFPGVYQRGKKFVARHIIGNKSHSATFDTAKEAHDCYLLMMDNNFKRTNQVKTSNYCLIDGCKNKYHAKGLCKKHYAEMLRKDFPRKIIENKTGFSGVKFEKGRYSSRHNNKYLGMFDTPEEAHAAYLKAKEEHIQLRTIKESPIIGSIPREKIKEAVKSVCDIRKAKEEHE